LFYAEKTDQGNRSSGIGAILHETIAVGKTRREQMQVPNEGR